jgi:NDP-sugar pyrophosphorylase family protein
MNEKLTAFIPAAGFGERLRPVTDHIPKPLIPVIGKPLIESVLERLSVLPVSQVGMNLHYKKEMIVDWLERSYFRNRVTLFPEDPILGTGGALKNAEIFLREGPFLVHNSDILSEIDLGKLYESHRSSGNFITLAVHDYPEFNNLVVDENGFLKAISRTGNYGMSGAVRILAFTGIAFYSPGFLRFLPAGKSSVVDAWLKAEDAGHKVGTYDVSGSFWSDIGTPRSYASTVFTMLKKNGESVYIDRSVTGCVHAEVDGYIVLEKGCEIGEKVFVRNCIALPGSRLNGLVKYENCIAVGESIVPFRESAVLESNGKGEIFIGTGGSDRKYFRTRTGTSSAVKMRCTEIDKDFERHIEYTRFFRNHDVPVPELISIEPESKSAVFEDLGDISLYGWLKCPRGNAAVERVYKSVLDILVHLQTRVTRAVEECPLLHERLFDYDHFRWETSYFMERFVRGLLHLETGDLSDIDREFHGLAAKADASPKVIVHRDFQSQNIMITGGMPRIIDFQGARMGPAAFDVASLLWDPYHQLETGLREVLLNHFISGLREKSDGVFREREFRGALLTCRLQRHMQALGAYGFLAMEKGKKYFLNYIPEALRLLKEEAFLSTDEYPFLSKMISTLEWTVQ